MEKSNHINAKEAFEQLWKKRNTFIIAWVITIIVVGAFSFLLPRKWECSMKVVPEYNLQESEALQGLFYELNTSMHLSPMGDAIAPILYADVIQDATFLSELAQQQVCDQKGNTITIQSLYPKAQTPEAMYDRMRKDIRCKMEKKNESINLSVIANDPVVAQQMVQLIYAQLSAYITHYRTEKAQRNLSYYARLADNGNVAATLYEIAKIRAEEHQPPLIIIQQAELPINTIAPKRIQMIIIALLLVSIGLVIWCWRKEMAEWL